MQVRGITWGAKRARAGFHEWLGRIVPSPKRLCQSRRCTTSAPMLHRTSSLSLFSSRRLVLASDIIPFVSSCCAAHEHSPTLDSAALPPLPRSPRSRGTSHDKTTPNAPAAPWRPGQSIMRRPSSPTCPLTGPSLARWWPLSTAPKTFRM
jgi:hypothetical protein